MENHLIAELNHILQYENISKKELIKSANSFASEIASFLEKYGEEVVCCQKLYETLYTLSILQKSSKNAERKDIRRFVKCIKKSLELNIRLLLRRIKIKPIEQRNISTFDKYLWKASKVDLVELTYALVESGAIVSANGEKVKIECLCQELASLFDVELAKPSQKFHEIQNRKTVSRLSFLDRLMTVLTRKLDSRDLK